MIMAAQLASTVAVLLVLLQLALYAIPKSLPEIIDLSYPYDNKTYYWPVKNKPNGFNIETIFKGKVETGTWYQAKEFCSREHGGTHMDAPSHFYEKGWSVDAIPVDKLMAPAIVVDIRKKAANNPDAKVEVSDLEKWETENGEIPPGSVVLMLSGWGQYWGNLTAYVGNKDDDYTKFHFPGFDVEAGKWLLKRKIVGLGVDTPSIDPGNDKQFRTHIALSKENIYNLENVANLDRLTPKGFTLMVAPIKIRDGSGGPTRLLAVASGAVEMLSSVAVVAAMASISMVGRSATLAFS